MASLSAGNYWPYSEMIASSEIGIRDHGALDLVRAIIRQGISVRIRVTGNSMRPLLKGGEIVELMPLQAKLPKIGDIVFLCDHQGNPLLHRVLRYRCCRNKKIWLQTKGDACSGFDDFVSMERVVGRARRILASPDAGSAGRTIDLQSPLMLLKSRLIVSRSLMGYFLRRAASLLSKMNLPL